MTDKADSCGNCRPQSSQVKRLVSVDLAAGTDRLVEPFRRLRYYYYYYYYYTAINPPALNTVTTNSTSLTLPQILCELRWTKHQQNQKDI